MIYRFMLKRILSEINFLFAGNKKARRIFHPVLSFYFGSSEDQLLCIQCLFDICDNILRIFDAYR